MTSERGKEHNEFKAFVNILHWERIEVSKKIVVPFVEIIYKTLRQNAEWMHNLRAGLLKRSRSMKSGHSKANEML